jgi:hypothetical protein
MLDVGSRGSYALDGCATRRPQAPHVPTRRTGQIGRECLDRVREVVTADNRGCHRVQIDSSAGGISRHLSALSAQFSRTDAPCNCRYRPRATAVARAA